MLCPPRDTDERHQESPCAEFLKPKQSVDSESGSRQSLDQSLSAVGRLCAAIHGAPMYEPLREGISTTSPQDRAGETSCSPGVICARNFLAFPQDRQSPPTPEALRKITTYSTLHLCTGAAPTRAVDQCVAARDGGTNWVAKHEGIKAEYMKQRTTNPELPDIITTFKKRTHAVRVPQKAGQVFVMGSIMGYYNRWCTINGQAHPTPLNLNSGEGCMGILEVVVLNRDEFSRRHMKTAEQECEGNIENLPKAKKRVESRLGQFGMVEFSDPSGASGYRFDPSVASKYREKNSKRKVVEDNSSAAPLKRSCLERNSGASSGPVAAVSSHSNGQGHIACPPPPPPLLLGRPVDAGPTSVELEREANLRARIPSPASTGTPSVPVDGVVEGIKDYGFLNSEGTLYGPKVVKTGNEEYETILKAQVTVTSSFLPHVVMTRVSFLC